MEGRAVAEDTADDVKCTQRVFFFFFWLLLQCDTEVSQIWSSVKIGWGLKHTVPHSTDAERSREIKIEAMRFKNKTLKQPEPEIVYIYIYTYGKAEVPLSIAVR